MAGNFQITAFEQTKEAKPDDMIGTCSGRALNSGSNDYGGVVVIDLDTQKPIQAGVTTEPVPAGAGMAWDFIQHKDVKMPNKDMRLLCGVGYYVVAENTVYGTDEREFTIKKTAGLGTWTYLAIGGAALLGVLLVAKTKK